MHLYPIFKTGVTLSEMPFNISYYIQLANCGIKCNGCHSKYLWNNIEYSSLKQIENDIILQKKNGADLIIIFGDVNNGISSDDLLFMVKELNKYLPICIYSGADSCSGSLGINEKEILKYINYLKLGHFDSLFGGLNSSKTNQKLYTVNNGILTKDITKLTFRSWTYDFKTKQETN